MRVKASVFVLLTVVAVAVSAGSRDGTQAFNVLLSDEDSGFLSGCTEVRVYAIDPVLGTRQSEVPVAVLSHPASPIELTLEPGRYELAIWMFYLPFEVPYMMFDVAEDGVNVFNVMTVELPEELQTY
ncbi:MAG: hypothetical protein PHV11_05235 [Candidatus Bipolaricaulis sp.]|nr:hypothetical protein [Candidatus Bipolaricaulis sp.]MDD5645875.1 hypothetical protein [Candidatus Bipolaricaulis sp.]